MAAVALPISPRTRLFRSLANLLVADAWLLSARVSCTAQLHRPHEHAAPFCHGRANLWELSQAPVTQQLALCALLLYLSTLLL